MTVQANKDLIQRYAKEIYNEHNLDLYDKFVGDGLEESGLDHMRQFFTAFPDASCVVEDLIAEGDKVVCRLLINGTNLGSFAGRPPTGKRVQFRSFRVYRIAGGKIVESWAMQDRLGLMEQLGFVQSTAAEVNWAAGDEE